MVQWSPRDDTVEGKRWWAGDGWMARWCLVGRRARGPSAHSRPDTGRFVLNSRGTPGALAARKRTRQASQRAVSDEPPSRDVYGDLATAWEPLLRCDAARPQAGGWWRARRWRGQLSTRNGLCTRNGRGTDDLGQHLLVERRLPFLGAQVSQGKACTRRPRYGVLWESRERGNRRVVTPCTRRYPDRVLGPQLLTTSVVAVQKGNMQG